MTQQKEIFGLPNCSNKTVEEYGLDLIKMGLEIIPLSVKKVPQIKDWNNIKVTKELWKKWCNNDKPEAVGLITGKIISVIDLDQNFDQELIDKLISLGTAYYKTTRGYHFLILNSGNKTQNLYYKDQHVGEFLGLNHLAMIPPSKDRKFISSTVRKVDIESIFSLSKPTPEAPSNDLKTSGVWAEGTRNNNLTSEAGKIVNNFVGLASGNDALLNELKIINNARSKPPLAEAEVESIANSVWSKYRSEDYQDDIVNADIFTPFFSESEVISFDDYKFIGDFMNYFQGGDVTFRLGACLSILSSIINPDINIKTYGKKTSALWVMLVGAPAKAFKSTVIKESKQLLVDAGAEEVVSPDSFSVERLENYIAGRDHKSNIFFDSEFSGKMKELGRDQSKNLSSQLIKFWDGESIHKELVGERTKDSEGNITKNPEVYKAENPHLSALVGLQPNLFMGSYKTKTKDEGFIIRWIIIPSDNPRRMTRREYKEVERDPNLYDQLKKQLANIFHTNKTGIYSLSMAESQDKILDDYEAFITSLTDVLPDLHVGESMFPRFITNAEKITLILALSRGATEISDIDVKTGILLAEIFRIKAYRFLETHALSKLENDINKAIKYLSSRIDKRASRSEILKNPTGLQNRSKKEMTDLEEDLLDRGLITISKAGTNNNKTIWNLVEKKKEKIAHADERWANQMLGKLFPSRRAL